MKRVIAAVLISGFVSIGLIGCSKTENASASKELKIATPGGTTTVTTKTDIKKTGENPPASTH